MENEKSEYKIIAASTVDDLQDENTASKTQPLQAAAPAPHPVKTAPEVPNPQAVQSAPPPPVQAPPQYVQPAPLPPVQAGPQIPRAHTANTASEQSGASQNTAYQSMQGANQSQQPAYQQQAAYRPQEYAANQPQISYAGSDSAPLSVGQYVWMFILSCIPIVGIIFLFVWAFGSRNINRKNYARAALILTAIGIFLWVIIAIATISIGGFISNLKS